MTRQSYFLIAFDGTHAALEAEAFFKKMKANVRLIPLPSVIAAGCGFSIKVPISEEPSIKPLLKQPLFAQAKFYKIIKENNQTNIEIWKVEDH